MNILIIGAGTLGSAICAQLSKENHDITVVDSDDSRLTTLSNNYDIRTFTGDASDIELLRRAGAEKADLLVAVTSKDEINVLCSAAARKLGTKHTIVRVRNPDYSGIIRLMKDELGVSMVINPELTAAREIYRMLLFPAAAKIDTFCRGRVEIAQYTIPEGSMLDGVTLNEIRGKLGISFLVCSVVRDDEAHIPSGNFVMKAGDSICITASEDSIVSFFKAIKAYKTPTKNLIIVGGGRITYYLEEFLARTNIESTIIERDKAVCNTLASQFDCTVVCDDPTKQDMLIEEGIERADALLALSGVDEENAIVSMFAKTKNVKQVVTLISNLSYINFFKSVGLDSVVSPRLSMAATVQRYVRAMVTSEDSEMESLHKLMDGKVEAVEYIVKSDIPGITSIPIKNMKFRSGVLAVCIARKDKVIIPSGIDTIEAGDIVIIVSNAGQINNLKDILKR